MPPELPFPASEIGLELHRRLLDDPAAQSDICLAYVLPLSGWLGRCFPAVDPHLRMSAVHDALIDYLTHPERFDPARSELGNYLRMLARGDLLNLSKKEQRRQKRRQSLQNVEVADVCGNISTDGDLALDLLERAETAERSQGILQDVRQTCNAEEAGILELMLAGEQATDSFSSVLGIEDLSPEEKRRTVKRVKDRLKQRIKRRCNSHE